MTRNLRKPISYCCEDMESNLEEGDMVTYKWYTREYILRSSITPNVISTIDFCPWCGKKINNASVYDEYMEAYEKAKKEDPTLPDVPYHFEFQDFQEKLLRDWKESEEFQEKLLREWKEVEEFQESFLRDWESKN